jgi:hypothetical protein
MWPHIAGTAVNLRTAVGSSIEKLTHQGKYIVTLSRSSYLDFFHKLSGERRNFGQSVETEMTHPQSGGKAPRDFARLEAEITGALGVRGSRVLTEGTRVFYPPARHREPLAVVRPADATDVATVFRRAAAEGFRVAVRSGGHCFDGFPIQEDTVLLDLSHLNDARLHADGRLHAGPGARILDLAKDLDASGRAVPTGDCPTVALGGLVSGGGLGYATRMLGLTTDNLVEAQVVTADGEIHRVSQDRNPDLFCYAVVSPRRPPSPGSSPRALPPRRCAKRWWRRGRSPSPSSCPPWDRSPTTLQSPMSQPISPPTRTWIPERHCAGRPLPRSSWCLRRHCSACSPMSPAAGAHCLMGAAIAVETVPLFAMLGASATLVIVAGASGLATVAGAWSSATAAAIPEQFPTVDRFSGIAVGYNLAVAVFGWLTPLAATLLIERTGVALAPALACAGCGLIGALATRWMPETVRRPLS